MFRKILSVAKFLLTSSPAQRILMKSITIFPASVISIDIPPVKPIGNETTINTDDLADAIMNVLRTGNGYLIDLIQSLEKDVKMICTKYRQVLEEQIDIMEKNKDSGPFSEAWGEIIKLRVQAAEAEKELGKVQVLVESIEQLGMQAAKDAENDIESAIANLRRSCDEQIKKNELIEKKLRKATKLDIFHIK